MLLVLVQLLHQFPMEERFLRDFFMCFFDVFFVFCFCCVSASAAFLHLLLFCFCCSAFAAFVAFLLLLFFCFCCFSAFLCFCFSALCFCCFSALAAVLLSLFVFAFPYFCFLTFFRSGVLLGGVLRPPQSPPAPRNLHFISDTRA